MNTLKKNRKALLCLALLVCVIASLFAVMAVPAGAADATAETTAEWGESFSASRYYIIDDYVTSTGSMTVEAEISIPVEYKSVRGGVIVGNYGTADHCMSIEYYSGKIRAYTNSGDVKFDYDVTQDLFTKDANGNEVSKYAKISVVMTPGNGTMSASLYVNGVDGGTQSTNYNGGMTSDYFSYLNEDKMWVGGDPRANNAQYFKGSIRNVSIYSDARTVQEMVAYGTSNEFTVQANDENLICAYDLTNSYGNKLVDLSDKNNNATGYGWSIDNDTRGRTFTSSDALYLTKDLTSVPKTYEAMVYAPTDKVTDDRIGVIFGNYYANPACLNFEIHNYGYPTIHMDNTADSGGVTAYKIPYNVTTNSGWIHIAIVQYDNVTKVVDGVEKTVTEYVLYLNGVRVAYLDGKTVDYTMSAIQTANKFTLGRDSRSGNGRWFQGRIKNVALYSEALTAEEVFASYKNGVGTVRDKDSGLILNYDMTTVESANYQEDLSGNEHHVTQNGVPYESFFEGRGFDVDDELYLEKPLTKQPQTYESWVLAPKSISRTGVMLGNFGSGSTSLINFEIYSNGAPSVYIQNENGNLMQQKFNYSINNDEWSHVVITHEYLENGGARFTCYVNGAEVDSFDTELDYKIADISSVTSLSLGRDSRGGNAQYFKGRIKNVALYSNVLTLAEIQDSYQNGINTANESLMVYYNLQGTDGAEEIKDSSSNGNDAHSLFYENENTLVKCPGGDCDHTTCDYVYSFAVVGDTQKLVYHDVHNGEGETDYVHYIYDWLVANKDSKNIKLVMGVGDITDKNEDAEYVLAIEQFEKLANAGILYSITPGNHDGPDTYTRYNSYFSALTSLTSNISGYYGAVGENGREENKTQVANYYIKTEIEGQKYMIFSLQYGPNDDILAWAGDICDANKDYKVIITTHANMFRDGTTLDINDVVPPREETSGSTRNNGDQIWTKFTSQHENIVMIFSGHDPYANIAWRQDLGVNGNTVTQMLIDFQTMDTTYSYKTGMVAMFYVSADGKTVKVEYVSTYNSTEQNKEIIYNAYTNQFEFTIPDKVTLTDVEVTINGVDGYVVDAKYSNEITYPFVVFKTDKTFVGGYGDLGAATAAAKAEGGAGNYVILMRRDAEQNTKSDGLSGVTGSITVDLGGHTLYKCQTGYIFDIYVDNNLDATLTDGVDVRGTYSLQNGTVISYSTLPLVGVNYGSSLDYTYSVSFIFKGITFVDKVGKNNILATWENGYNSLNNEAKAKTFVLFDECTFDYSSSLEGTNTNMVVLTHENWYDRAVYDVVIKGGKIISDTPVSYSTFIKKDGNANGRADKVTFEKGSDGEYIIQVLPEAVTDAALSSIWKNTDGTKYLFVRAEVLGGNAVYKLSSENINSYGSELKYGFVPSAYLDTSKYPVLLFKNGDFIGGYSVYANGTNDGATSAIAMAKFLTDGNYYGEIGSEAQILLRADATTSGGFSNTGQILGTIVVDLNGFTLTQGHTNSALFSTVAKNWMGMQDATFKVFGGNIVLQNELMAFDAYDDASYADKDGYKTTNMYFSDVNFTFASGASVTNFLGKFGESLSEGKAKETVYNVSFDNCVFDLTNAASVSIIMNANDSNTNACNSIVKVNVKGGEIITSNPAISLYAENTANGSSVVFAKADAGNYTAMTVKNSTVAPTATANGGTLVFVKVSETADSVTYRLRLAELSGINYNIKTSITLDSQLVINAYVPVESTLKFTFGIDSYENLNEITSKIVTLSDGKQYYLVSVALPSAEAADDVKLVATISANSQSVTVTFTLSIPRYAEKVLRDEESTNIEKTLVKDVLSYVQAAYNYFTDFNSEEKIASVNAIVNELLVLGGEYESNPNYDKAGTVNKDLISDAALVLDEKPTIRFYGVADGVEFYAYDVLLKTKEGSDENGAYVELDVYAYVLSELITYKSKSGEEWGTYCLYDYLAQTEADEELMASDKAMELISLIVCFINYTEGAADYRDIAVNGASN